MVLLDGGMVATSTDCCCGDVLCPDCVCWQSTPFEDGLGGFWTKQTFDCDIPGIVYSGPTTFDAKYRTVHYHIICCEGCTENCGPFDCQDFAFCNTDIEACDGGTTCNDLPSPQCVGTIAAGYIELLNLVDPPCP